MTFSNDNSIHSLYDRKHGVVFGTLSKGTDLMDGLLRVAEKHQLQSGVVTCIGSLAYATYVHAKDDEHGNLFYSEPVVVNGPIEVLNGTGFLCRTENGGFDIHMHAVFVDKQGRPFGGHVFPGKNPTLVTIEFAIQVGEGIEAVRSYKPDLGFRTIHFRRKED